MNYIYKITCIPNGRMYIGQRQYKGDPFEDDYFGSSGNPDFYADLELYPNIYTDWQKEILEIVDGDTKLLDDRETYWIGQWFDGGKICYNINPIGGGGGWSGANAVKTFEQRSAMGKRAAEVEKELGINFFNSEFQREQNKKGIQTCKEKCAGVFDPTHFVAKLGHMSAMKNGSGFENPDYQQLMHAIQKAAGVGIYDTRMYCWYLEDTGDLIYIGKELYADQMMKARNQIWVKKEQVSEDLLTNKEWFESHRSVYHPSRDTLMTNGKKIISCAGVKASVDRGKTTWQEWTLTEFTS